MLWGITNKPVVVFTDNKALSAFLQSPTIPASLCKYVDRLLQFKFVLAHVAGENNPAADYLSRMYLNPHLTMELEIGATIPVHQVEVRLKPQIQTETAIQNADGSPPTPSPPASPRRDSDEEEEEASNFPIQRKMDNKKDIIAKMEQMEEWIPYQINAVEQPDPSHMLSMETRRNRLDMQQEQDKDENLRRVKHWITHKIIPETKYENAELQHYAKQLTRMNLSDEGILTRRFYHHDGKSYDQQLIIPEHLRHEVLTYLHNDKTAAHRGARKTIEQCRRYFYWPNFNQDISEWIQNCLKCARIKPIADIHIKPAMQPVTSLTSLPGDMLQIDFIGPFAPSNGFTQVMTAIDVFTKYLFATPIRRVTAQTVAEVLTQIFLKHTYIPKVIMTDEGSQFTSNLMKDVTTSLDIELQHATVKHAQTIGLLERAHAGIKKTLKFYQNQEHADWHKFLDYAVFAHNTNYNPQTKTTPSDLFHGFAPHKALETRFQVPYRKTPQFQTTQQIQNKMKELYKQQKQNLMDTYVRHKKYYDRKAQAHPLKIHSYCLLLNPKLDTQKQQMNKMQDKWLALYRVEKKLTNENYLVREVGTHHTQLVHRIRLRSYSPRFIIKDLDHIDKDKFIPDPRFPDEYREPQIFDKAYEKLLWHPDLAENQDTDPRARGPRPKKYALFTNQPRVQLTRLNMRKLPENTHLPRGNGKTPLQKTAPGNAVSLKTQPSMQTRQMAKPTNQTATTSAKTAPANVVTGTKPKTIATKFKETTKKVLSGKLQKLLLHQVEEAPKEETPKDVALLIQQKEEANMGEFQNKNSPTTKTAKLENTMGEQQENSPPPPHKNCTNRKTHTI